MTLSAVQSPPPNALGFRLDQHGQKWTLSRVAPDGTGGPSRVASVEEVAMWLQLQALWDVLAVVAERKDVAAARVRS